MQSPTHTIAGLLAGLLLSIAVARVAVAVDDGPEKRLAAQVYDSQFPQGHDTYNGMGVGSDGRIYYVLSTDSLDVGARMFAFDPATRRIQALADLTEACGEQGRKAIPQGKSHVNFVECQEKLYFATHVGVYSTIDGMEKMPIPPAGYKPYPGGHVLAYDLRCGRCDDLGQAPGGEGIITLSMDTQRARIFCMSWPKGRFLRLNVATREMKDFGIMAGEGEDGQGPSLFTICRSIAVDPRDGSAYFTIATGAIFRYRADRDAVEKVAGEDLRKDYFGLYDPNSPGHMGYNWRQAVWYPAERAFYGVHGNSGYLFRFDPRVPRVDMIERITSLASQRSGMFDQFSYGYLGFALGPDGHTLHYLTGGPVYEHGKRVAGKNRTARGESKGLEDLHLVTYDIAAGKYADHGAIFFPDGQRPYYVNSIAVGKEGTVYFLSRVTQQGRTRTDLASVPSPLR